MPRRASTPISMNSPGSLRMYGSPSGTRGSARPADEDALEVDDVGDVVADRPPGATGDAERLPVVEIRGQRVDIGEDLRVGGL